MMQLDRCLKLPQMIGFLKEFDDSMAYSSGSVWLSVHFRVYLA